MALFRFTWLRNFIRKNTSPIPEVRAEDAKRKLSYIYAFLSWNAFGIIVYMFYQGKQDWGAKYRSPEEDALTPAQRFSRLFGIKEAKVYRVSPAGVTSYEIHNEDVEK